MAGVGIGEAVKVAAGVSVRGSGTVAGGRFVETNVADNVSGKGCKGDWFESISNKPATTTETSANTTAPITPQVRQRRPPNIPSFEDGAILKNTCKFGCVTCNIWMGL
jgi:hypothetical protein